jgi:hypothetical protein
VNGGRRFASAALFVGEDDEMRLAHWLDLSPGGGEARLRVKGL